MSRLRSSRDSDSRVKSRCSHLIRDGLIFYGPIKRTFFFLLFFFGGGGGGGGRGCGPGSNMI